jgi:hypothetical protein
MSAAADDGKNNILKTLVNGIIEGSPDRACGRILFDYCDNKFAKARL